MAEQYHILLAGLELEPNADSFEICCCDVKPAGPGLEIADQQPKRGCDVPCYLHTSQLNAGSIFAIDCFNEYEDKKSQILKTTESGFGGG